MRVTIEEIELGPSRAVAFDRGSASWAIVLPGAGYSAQAPLLWYARFAALVAGRNALVVTDAFDRRRDEPLRWVEERAQAAVDRARQQDRHPLVVAKSLSSLAASLVARETLPAIWLTPLIAAGGTSAASVVVTGLRAGTERRLLVGGTADRTWDGDVAGSLAVATILELPGADHSLEVEGDLARSLSNLGTVAEAMARFMKPPT